MVLFGFYGMAHFYASIASCLVNTWFLWRKGYGPGNWAVMFLIFGPLVSTIMLFVLPSLVHPGEVGRARLVHPHLRPYGRGMLASMGVRSYGFARFL